MKSGNRRRFEEMHTTYICIECPRIQMLLKEMRISNKKGHKHPLKLLCKSVLILQSTRNLTQPAPIFFHFKFSKVIESPEQRDYQNIFNICYIFVIIEKRSERNSLILFIKLLLLFNLCWSRLDTCSKSYKEVRSKWICNHRWCNSTPSFGFLYPQNQFCKRCSSDIRTTRNLRG